MAIAKNAAPAEVSISATVAPGRCVHVGNQVLTAGQRVTFAGDEAEAEVERLTRTGHLVDPFAEEIQRGEGPVFDTKTGVKVKQA